ncbi:MarR family winged helix-turn-helix transcriptional regulator [Terasakiella pusilla]|uniref:MarR family winged helix-turn-helix transcriptional regulator n=1 Tax=Terasakiella pusilla TaxID=64973 RepID=UPI00068AD2D1|nr:MarR family transcriptional regulator [Terasakiella pusilla]
MKQLKKTTKQDHQTKVKVTDKTLREFMGYNMKRTFNVFHSDLAKVLEPFDLRMVTYSALVLIVDNPGMRQSQLADALAIERPNLVVIVDELERRELILREPSKTDRRAYSLSATLKGKRLCEKASQANRESEARLLSCLDEETKKTVQAALHLIRISSGRGEDETDKKVQVT